MADTYEKDLAQKSSLTTSDYIRVVGTDNVSYKQKLLDVGATGQIGQMGLLSDQNIDHMATNNTYGTWWLNCGDSAITGTKPASSGQGLLVCKRQSTSVYRQVYVGISGSDFKFRYCSNGSWTAWSNSAIRDELDALNSNTVISATLASGITGWVEYAKTGKIVTGNYSITTGSTALSSGDVIATGLPRPYRGYTTGDFKVFNTSGYIRVADISAKGQLSLSGATTFSANTQYRGTFTYLCD